MAYTPQDEDDGDDGDEEEVPLAPLMEGIKFPHKPLDHMATLVDVQRSDVAMLNYSLDAIGKAHEVAVGPETICKLNNALLKTMQERRRLMSLSYGAVSPDEEGISNPPMDPFDDEDISTNHII